MKFLCILSFILTVTSMSAQKNEKRVLPAPKGTGYDLTSPDRIYTLPASLYEISGITEIDNSTIACVQDEFGIVFIYDLVRGEISRQFAFGGQGDYEGIARTGSSLYILRSDEVLIEIADFGSRNFKRNAYETAIPGKDCEALCYETGKNRLLISPKEPGDNPDNKGKRFIYGFDIASKKLVRGPVMTIEISDLEKFALRNKIKVPVKAAKGRKQVPDIKLQLSAIAIHPIDGRLYAISASDRLLLVFNMNGVLEHLERLDKNLFGQPEGITFLKKGDLLISNEGGQGLATLLRFGRTSH